MRFAGIWLLANCVRVATPATVVVESGSNIGARPLKSPWSLRRRRHDADVGDTLLAPVPFVAGKEEGLVSPVEHSGNHHRTAERPAELIARELFLVHREEVLRVERVVARELEEAAVKRVAAGLGRHVERGAGAMEFRRIRVLLHAEFLERVDRRLNPGAPLMLFSDVHAVEEEPCLRAGDTADHVAVGDLGAHGLRVACRRQQRDAGSEPGKLVKASAVERQVDDLLVRDHLAERRRLGIERRCFGDDLHLCGEPAEIQRQLDTGRLADGERQPFAHGSLKAGDFCADAVVTGIERGNDVIAFRVGLGGSRDVGRQICHRHRGARYAGALRIEYGAQDAARLKLREHIRTRQACRARRAQLLRQTSSST